MGPFFNSACGYELCRNRQMISLDATLSRSWRTIDQGRFVRSVQATGTLPRLYTFAEIFGDIKSGFPGVP